MVRLGFAVSNAWKPAGFRPPHYWSDRRADVPGTARVGKTNARNCNAKRRPKLRNRSLFHAEKEILHSFPRKVFKVAGYREDSFPYRKLNRKIPVTESGRTEILWARKVGRLRDRFSDITLKQCEATGSKLPANDPGDGASIIPILKNNASARKKVWNCFWYRGREIVRNERYSLRGAPHVDFDSHIGIRKINCESTLFCHHPSPYRREFG